MNRVMIHPEVWEDLKKRHCPGLGKELPRICKLLTQDGILPGERPIHYLTLTTLQNKTFHAGINLPGENVGKRRGGRIVYVKEGFGLLKIVYVGSHKDKRYDNPHALVDLICERYQAPESFYKIYNNDSKFT